jgi:hypothetical protein
VQRYCPKTFPFFLLISFIFFCPVYVSPWFLCGLARVAENLMKVLEIRFPAHGVMNALGIVFPNIGYNQIVMHLLLITFRFLK